jgi:lipopolysaccharide biosynthesis protein
MTDPSPSKSTGEASLPIAVFVHVYYIDVWNQLAALLAERMPVPFRLILTTSLPAETLVLPQTPMLVDASVLVMENRGRDIRPFLAAFQQTSGYSVGLKLHTKRSEHRLDGSAWRDDLLNALLPPLERASALIDAIRADPRIGLLAPDGALLPLEPWILRNMAGLRRVAGVLGHALDDEQIRRAHFSAGSMFWFRRDALAGLENPKLQEMFEREKGQVDGTTAHAVERLFAFTAEQHGFFVLTGALLPAFDRDVGHAEWQGRLNDLAPSSSAFLTPQSPLLRAVDRHLPWLKTVYRRLPTPARRALRRMLTGA